MAHLYISIKKLIFQLFMCTKKPTTLLTVTRCKVTYCAMQCGSHIQIYKLIKLPAYTYHALSCLPFRICLLRNPKLNN